MKAGGYALATALCRTGRIYQMLSKHPYPAAVSLVHAILGVRAQPHFLRRAGGFPGSHGPDDIVRSVGKEGVKDQAAAIG